MEVATKKTVNEMERIYEAGSLEIGFGKRRLTDVYQDYVFSWVWVCGECLQITSV
jgi:hypothetical protein